MTDTLPLKPPPADFHQRSLQVVGVPARSLCRVSWHDTNEPFFNPAEGTRFADDNPALADRYATCYLGFEYAVAFAESVLHNEEPVNGGFLIPTSMIERRFFLGFKGNQDVKLANMTGTHLLSMGANGGISGTHDYTLPRRWAAAVASHPDQVDGILYMSRRVNDKPAVVLFKRANANPPPIQMATTIPLHHHVQFLDTLRVVNITMT